MMRAQTTHSQHRWFLNAGEAEPVQVLHLLFWLRTVAIGSQAAAIAFVHYGLGIALPLRPLAATLAALAAWNVFVRVRIARQSHVSRGEVALNLAVDVLAFTSVIYFTGGASNPFVSLYLLPISLAAASLPAAYAWLVGVLCASGYTFLLLAVHHTPMFERLGNFDLHIAGMWVNFLVAAVLIVFFVGRTARLLRRRDRELAAMREEALRDQQLVALGTLAAGTAHELNTPLATLALLVEELEDTLPDRSAEPCLAAMNEQIETISRRLTELARNVGAERSERATSMRLERFIEGLVQRWRAAHRDIPLGIRYEAPVPSIDIVAEATVEQAIRNVLDNAAEAVAGNAAGRVAITVDCRGGRLAMTVADDGPGLAPGLQDDVGARIVSTKERGLGIGLLLSRASLERFGGALRLGNRAEGGVEARIELPLGGLMAGERAGAAKSGLRSDSEATDAAKAGLHSDRELAGTAAPASPRHARADAR
jgi:two-component system sensor histidine kinase RegB